MISASTRSRARHDGPSSAGKPSRWAIAATAATCPCGTDRAMVNSLPAGTSCSPLSPASIQSTTCSGSAGQVGDRLVAHPLALAVGAAQIRRGVLAGVAMLIHVRFPDSDYVNLPVSPRHAKQLNGYTEIILADTPRYSDYIFRPVRTHSSGQQSNRPAQLPQLRASGAPVLRPVVVPSAAGNQSR